MMISCIISGKTIQSIYGIEHVNIFDRFKRRVLKSMKILLIFVFLFLVAYAALETFKFFYFKYGMFVGITASIDVIWFFFAIYFLILIFYDLFAKKYK